MAVALKLLFGEHGQTLNVFTMELGREGILNDDYYALARRACDVPYAGAWFWRQTTVCRDTAGWDGAVDVRQAIADRASVGPLAGAESARRLTMQEEFELFKGKYGGVRVDEELETVVRMARLAAAADVSASGGAQDDQ